MEVTYLNITLGLSALCCASAFIIPPWCAELQFVGWVLLWYCVIQYQERIGLVQACIWGALFYGVYWYGIACFLWMHAQKFQEIAFIFLLSYSVSTVLGWFFIASAPRRVLVRTYPRIKSICWIASAVMYLWWVDTHFFWIFGQKGNQLAWVWLPFLVRQWSWHIAACFSRHFLTAVWVIGTAGVAVSLARYFYTTLLWCIGSYTILLFSCWMSQPSTLIKMPSVCCVVPRSQSREQETYWERAHNIEILLQHAHKTTGADLFIFPESAFPYALNHVPEVLSLWKSAPGICVLGAHYQKKGKLYNSFYVFDTQSSRITYRYDKKSPLFFTETIPTFWKKLSWCHQLFLTNNLPFNKGKQRTTLFLKKLGSLSPYICADLFMKRNPCKPADYSICIVNDSWFASSYIPRLMFLHARYKALQSQQNIIYVSYTYQYLLAPDGHCYLLPTIYE